MKHVSLKQLRAVPQTFPGIFADGTEVARLMRPEAPLFLFSPEKLRARARRFRQAWTRRRSLEQVQRAVARAPANAGPLNSHALVLQSLELMRELSPDYLRRFLVHVEALQWLDAARQAYPRPKAPAAARRARAPRPRK